MDAKKFNQFKKGNGNGQKRINYRVYEPSIHVDFSSKEINAMSKVKAKAIMRAMDLTNHNRTKAGKILGISPRSIRYFLERFTKEGDSEDLPD